MPTPYTPDPSHNPATINVPSDGDDADGALFDGPYEDLADRTAHSQWPETDNTKRYPLASRTITRWHRNPPVARSRSGVLDWDLIEASGEVAPIQVNITDADSALIYFLDLPDGSTVTNVQVQVKGAGGHGAFPIGGFHLPVLSFVEFDPVTETTNVVAAASDPSANATAYQASHAIPVGFSQVIDNANKIYYMVLYGEYGTGAIAGLVSFGAFTQYTVDNMDPGA